MSNTVTCAMCRWKRDKPCGGHRPGWPRCASPDMAGILRRDPVTGQLRLSGERSCALLNKDGLCPCYQRRRLWHCLQAGMDVTGGPPLSGDSPPPAHVVATPKSAPEEEAP